MRACACAPNYTCVCIVIIVVVVVVGHWLLDVAFDTCYRLDRRSCVCVFDALLLLLLLMLLI